MSDTMFYETTDGGPPKPLICLRCGHPLKVLARHDDGSYAEIGCPTGENHTNFVYLEQGKLDLGTER